MNGTALLNITCWDGTFYYSPGWWCSSGCPHTGIRPPILVSRATTQAAMRRCLIFNVYFNIVRSYSNFLSSIFLLSFSGTLEMFGNSAGERKNVKCSIWEHQMSPSLCTPPFLCLRTSRDFASFCTELATPFPRNLTYIVVHIRFSSSVPVVTDILKRRHTPILCKYSVFHLITRNIQHRR